MTNAANSGILTGRLSREPVFFPNHDGSMKVKTTIAVQDNFKSGPDKKRESQFLPIEQFLPASMGKGAWANVTKGSLISAAYHCEANVYEKDGKTVYGGVNLVVDNVTYLETKATTAARVAANAAAAQPVAAAVTPDGAVDPMPFPAQG